MRFLKIGILLLISLGVGVGGDVHAGELYKYKDDKGKWVFSDKKPVGIQKVDTLQYKGNKKGLKEPSVYVENFDGRYSLVVDNPYYAPIEVEVKSAIFKRASHKEVVPESSTKALYVSHNEIPSYRYKWRLGDPGVDEDNYLYKIIIYTPFPYTQRYRIKLLSRSMVVFLILASLASMR